MSLDKRTRKILKTIYYAPYITLAEIKLKYPGYETESILYWLDKEKYISFRIAGSAAEDEGFESYPITDASHLLSIRKGDMEVEDRTLFRANAALIISFLSLVVSICAFIFR